MIRLLKNTASDITVTFYVGGTATNADGSVAVAVTDTTGGTVAAGTGIPTDLDGEYKFAVTSAHTARLDTFTVTWAAVIGGEAQTVTTTVEIVGGFLFTVADAFRMLGRAWQNNDGTWKLSAARISEARTEVERALEHELEFAMVPRFAVESFSGDGSRALMLRPHVRAIRHVTVNGAALTAGEVASMSASTGGTLYSPAGWPAGFQNVTVAYEHGLSVPPPRARDVALALAKRALTGSPADDRATTMSTEEQTTTFYVPGQGEPFDVPAANRFVASHTLRVGLA